MNEIKIIPGQAAEDSSRDNLSRLHGSILEFEKEFQAISDSKNINYKNSIFPDIDNLNNTLISIADLSTLEKLNDFIKLSESSCVFLNYIKNNNIDFYNDKIQDAVKFIIHIFKELFLKKEVKDFELFIHYLNNPSGVIIE